MSILTEHSERFGVPPETLHISLETIEGQWVRGASDADIAAWFVTHAPTSPYTRESAVAEFTRQLTEEERRAEEELRTRVREDIEAERASARIGAELKAEADQRLAEREIEL